jgi:exopolysaccharide/PEP-CTERM locus tyrosine autokinase
VGKIADALERHKKEASIVADKLPAGTYNTQENKTPESYFEPEIHAHQIFHPKLVVLSQPNSVDAENFKVLRSQILFPKNGKRKRVLMVTSGFPGEGKTFVSANLAVSIAKGINEYVLLVDCDFRRPHLHEMLGCPNREGLHEHLMEKKELSDLLIRTGIEKLSFLPAGSPSSKPSELLGSKEMKEFLVEVRERYGDRFIIIDAAPTQVTADAGVLSNYVEGIILVIMAGKTPREIVRKSVDQIGREKILGIVFNDYSKSFARYGKYYKGYYK